MYIYLLPRHASFQGLIKRHHPPQHNALTDFVEQLFRYGMFFLIHEIFPRFQWLTNNEPYQQSAKQPRLTKERRREKEMNRQRSKLYRFDPYDYSI